MKRRIPDNEPVSPADRAYFLNLFSSVAEEMGVTLTRTAYSPNIKERRDFSCAVFDAEGNMIAQAAHIPVHLGALPLSVAAAIEQCGPLHDGDVVLLNDPFRGGTHLPDLTLVSPVIPRRRSDPIGYLASRAHHADIGGMTPGSLPVARDIFQEGLRIPPVKLFRRGTINEDVLQLLLANVRTPEERQGDLRAQASAHHVGTQRLLEAIHVHGPERIQFQMQDLLAYGERMMRARMTHLPDGTYRFADQVDDDGVGTSNLPIRVTLTITGEEVSVDFTGSHPACAGGLNAVEAITRSAVYYCFLALLATPAENESNEAVPYPPLNSGCFRPIHLTIPPDSILDASAGHAVAGGNVETSQRIVDVMFGALAKAAPSELPAASQGTMNNMTVGGYDRFRDRMFAYYETMAGGTGGSRERPGLDAVHCHMTNTLNTPVEALEFAYPLRVLRYEIVSGTGGSGKHPGGCGLRRDVQALCDMRGALLTERRTSQPYGLAGGGPGGRGKNRLVRDGRSRTLPAKCELELKAGDVVSIQTPGGGGFGRLPPKSKSKK